MNKLSGNKQTDFLIMMKLSDNELGKVCQVNKYINSLCEDDNFWMQRVHIINKYSYEDALDMKRYLDFDTWKEYYLWLDEFKKCEKYHRKKMQFVEEDVDFYLKLLLVSLKRKHIIDDFISKYNEMKFPIWINKEGFLKTIKRNLFVKINREIILTCNEQRVTGDDDKIIMLSDKMSHKLVKYDLANHNWIEYGYDYELPEI